MFTLGDGTDPYLGKPEVLPLSAGDAGVFETLNRMRGLVHAATDYPEVKAAAVRGLARCPTRNPACQASALFQFAKDRFRYVPDTLGVEEVTAPWIHSRRILDRGATYGDCDDYAVTLAAWLQSVGIPSRFTVVASPKHGGVYDHVRTDAGVLGRWAPMEATLTRRKFGESVPAIRTQSLEI